MADLKNFLKRLSAAQIVFSLITIFSLLLYLLLTLWWKGQEKDLVDQQAADRWGGDEYAQVSCFVTRDVILDDFSIRNFENQLTKALAEAAVTLEDDQENGPGKQQETEESKRLFIDAYSAPGKVTLVSEQATLEADAIGIGNDFFYFHPLQLVDGRYFSENELMTDFVIVDEDAAWQLFGSNDISGMTVMIGGVQHTIAGVVKRDESRMAKNAGLTKTLVYVSVETLGDYGVSEGVNCYEVVAPNPVKGFVAKTVREKFGPKEDQMTVVENSSRYSVESMIPVILDFGTRSMQNAAIHYPYFENIARGYEDIRAVVLIFQFLFLLIPGVIILVFLIIKWKHRKYTTRDLIRILMDKKDRALEKARAEKDKWKDF